MPYITETEYSNIQKKLADRDDLLEVLRRLVERIDFNGGIGEYQGGPAFVMKAARQAIQKAEI